MHNSTSHVIKQLVHAFSCALSSYGALGKFGEHSCSPNFPRAPFHNSTTSPRFLRADSQRGEAELTITRRKRARASSLIVLV